MPIEQFRLLFKSCLAQIHEIVFWGVSSSDCRPEVAHRKMKKNKDDESSHLLVRHNDQNMLIYLSNGYTQNVSRDLTMLEYPCSGHFDLLKGGGRQELEFVL